MIKYKTLIAAAIFTGIAFISALSYFSYLAWTESRRNRCYVIQIDAPEKISISTDPAHPAPVGLYWKNGQLHLVIPK